MIEDIIPMISDDERVKRAAYILQGLNDSGTNLVIFRDDPEVWFQFYLGLYLAKPTFVLIKKRDLTDEIKQQLSYQIVKLIIVDDFNDNAMKLLTQTVATWVKRHE